MNSSCDLAPRRRRNASLLRILAIAASDPDAKGKLNLLLKFSRRESMYLPVMPADNPDVLCNVVQFDGILPGSPGRPASCRTGGVTLACRLADFRLVLENCFHEGQSEGGADAHGGVRRRDERSRMRTRLCQSHSTHQCQRRPEQRLELLLSALFARFPDCFLRYRR